MGGKDQLFIRQRSKHTHVWSVCEEPVLEELVGEEPLDQQHHKVELLAAEEVERVHVVLVVEVLLETLNNDDVKCEIF